MAAERRVEILFKEKSILTIVWFNYRCGGAFNEDTREILEDRLFNFEVDDSKERRF